MDPEDQIAAEIAAMEAQGIDPYADRPSDVTTEPAQTAEDKAPEAQASDAQPDAVQQEPTAPAEDAGEAQDPVNTEALAEIANPPAVLQPAVYRTDVPADLEARREALVTAKAEALEKMMGGEMTATEFAREEAKLSAEMESLVLARAQAITLAEVNRQTTEGYQRGVLQSLIASVKSEVDYQSSQEDRDRFDTAISLVAREPRFANKDFSVIAAEAHKLVLKTTDRQPKAPAVGSKTTAPDRTPPKPPVTLSGLPTAAASGVRSVAEVAGRLSGDELEKAFDSLSDADLQKLLRG